VSGADDLSGGWDGIYNYPHTRRPTAFTATLRDAAGMIVGETSEPATMPGERVSVLHALLEGSRDGASVHFTKTYDEPGHARRNPVLYIGTVNGEGTEITGRWEIPGNWSGRFIMVRQASEGELVEVKIAEAVGDQGAGARQ
jgi:hypothetical protein